MAQWETLSCVFSPETGGWGKGRKGGQYNRSPYEPRGSVGQTPGGGGGGGQPKGQKKGSRLFEDVEGNALAEVKHVSGGEV